MIVETTTRDIQRSASFEEKTMGLAVGSEAFVFNVLRKDLYSDPIGSLIREYTVNAQDEHRKYGKSDVPIHIQVPNQFTPELHIRDYAGGLTEEQVFNFFGNYGASDKRDSNIAVGFFGLGCKSAFAYTDSYIVKSFKDGMEYTFNIYIDETEIGKTAKISAEPTTEPNGIEIIVPVKTHDINTFQNKVMSTVRYFKTKPVITGMAETPEFDVKVAKIKGEGWEYFGNGSPVVIMGEIPYPVDRYKIPNLESWESSLLQSELVITVNIGDVQVTASREALQMSPKTIDTIRLRLADIKDTMIAETEKAFAEAKNLIEAKTLWQGLIGKGGGFSNIIRNCKNSLTWRGEALEDNVIRLDKTLHSVSTYYHRRARYNSNPTIKYDATSNIVCDGSDIYFDDTDKAEIGYKRRARTVLNSGAERVYIIHTTDKTALEDFLGMSVTELSSLNAVVPTKATSNRGYGTGVDLTKRAKHASKMFVLNVDKLRGNYRAASEVWDVKEVDNVDGVYIPIERFKPVDMHRIYDLDALYRVLYDLERANITINVPIYGIKNGGDTTGLTRFDDWVDAKIKSNKKLLKNYSVVKAFNEYTLVDTSQLRVENLPENSVAKTYTTVYNRAKKLNSKSDRFKILKYSSINVKADGRLRQLSNKFADTYPMLKYVNTWSYDKPEIINYIAEREAKGNI